MEECYLWRGTSCQQGQHAHKMPVGAATYIVLIVRHVEELGVLMMWGRDAARRNSQAVPVSLNEWLYRGQWFEWSFQIKIELYLKYGGSAAWIDVFSLMPRRLALLMHSRLHAVFTKRGALNFRPINLPCIDLAQKRERVAWVACHWTFTIEY